MHLGQEVCGDHLEQTHLVLAEQPFLSWALSTAQGTEAQQQRSGSDLWEDVQMRAGVWKLGSETSWDSPERATGVHQEILHLLIVTDRSL